MTQEEINLLVWWKLSPEFVPRDEIIDFMEDCIDWVQSILYNESWSSNYHIDHYMNASFTLTSAKYYYTIYDPWCWSPPSTPEQLELFELGLAKGLVKFSRRIDS